MSTTPKTYRLLKDLPYVKAGAIYKLDSPEGTYVCDSSTAEFNEGTAWDGLGVNAVENAAPGWFELITETPTEEFKWTDELVKDWGSYIRLREPNFEINEELQKWKQSKSTPPPKERIRVLGFCYVGASKDPILSNQTFFEYSFKTTKAIDPSLGLIGVIEKAINQ